MREVVVVSCCRTAVGRSGGVFANKRADELLADVLEAVVERANINKAIVDDIIIGCVTQIEEQAMNIARTAALIAQFPITVPGVTIDRQCGSSQQAVHFGAQAILAGDMDVVIAGGVESMSRAPMFSNVGETKQSERLTEQHDIVNQGIAAELIAEKWQLSREMLDEYALQSHERAIRALENKTFQDEIVPIGVIDENGERSKVVTDEGPRNDTNLPKLHALKTVFKRNGKITPGNASQMSDGASAVVLMDRKKADQLGIQPMARIVARTVVGSDPTLMLTGPIEATCDVLQRANLTIEDIDRYEVNEAFAPVPLAWLKEIGADPKKLNPHGGAIALGHPLGATGTKLLTSLIYELKRTGGKYGLLGICEGMGMANATIIERL